jgi:mono/diheme cytochrome c family protein
MNAMTRLLSPIVFVVLSGTIAVTATAQQGPDHRGSAQEGKRLALGKCDVCHVVASDQLYQPLLSHYAPSFHDVANRPKTTAQSLQAFLAHPHSYENMPYPDLTPAQVTDIINYILTLRGSH